jgi:hypothetical protein
VGGGEGQHADGGEAVIVGQCRVGTQSLFTWKFLTIIVFRSSVTEILYVSTICALRPVFTEIIRVFQSVTFVRVNQTVNA